MSNGTAMVIRDEPQRIEGMPAMSVEHAVKRFQTVVAFVQQVMRDGTDYGIVPGTVGKPTLFKPGAEKLCTLFGLAVEPPVLVERTEDWTGKDHGGEPFFYYLVRQDLTRGGVIVASQMGSCSSWESKYRYRNANRKCPHCGKEAIIKGKQEYGGGWVCFKRKDGCGATFADNAESITSQVAGRVKNADAADQVNTVLKMALKRALIAAALIATNASEFFTQDLDDLAPEPEPHPEPPARPARQPQKERAAPKPPPTSGAELEARLTQFDMSGAEQGRWKPGECIEHVRKAGVEHENLPEEFGRWEGRFLAQAMEVAQDFARKHPRHQKANA